MRKSAAHATWNGDLRGGSGTVGLGSGTWEGAYSFTTRFETTPGTNPEELLGAAFAGCYAMALANDLATAGFEPHEVRADAEVELTAADAGPSVTRIALTVRARVDGVDDAAFQEIALRTKSACPIARALNVPDIALDAALV